MKQDIIHPKKTNRWVQLTLAIFCMVMVANLQYGWTLFVNPLDTKYGWGKAAIQVAFSVFIVMQTWLVPFEGYFVDKFGPRFVAMFGGLLCAVSWTIYSVADSLPILYLGAAIGGIGAGSVYGTCIGTALKWFPDLRGFAAGLAAAGYGAGSALTIIPIANMIKSSGYEHTLLFFGLLQGIGVLVFAFFLKAPKKDDVPSGKAVVTQTKYDYKPVEMVKTPVFWVMYCMFVIVGAGGLMAVAQLGPIAHDFNIAKVPVSFIGITLPALSFALALDRILNGLTRPIFGWISDRIGRENTMFIAFSLESLAVLSLYYFGQDPLLFVILTALVFFAWGEIYSLFPSTCTDTFGAKFATTNAGLLYTAKGTASLLIPITSILAAKGGWHLIFGLVSVFDMIAALSALFILKPMRAKLINATNLKYKVNL